MGFWTDKDKKEEQQQHHQQGTEFDNNLFSAGVDSFRECRRDPSNEDYLFCKDVKQSLDNNGKWSREEGEEQRVSMDELYNNSLGSSVGPVNIFKNIFEGLNEFIQPAQLDKEIQSIFQQFKSSFFNPQQEKQQSQNDNDNHQKQQQNPHPRTSFSSFSSSSSRKCKSDENDNNYLICTTTTTKRTSDGQQTTDVKEKRMPVQGNRSNQLSDNREGFPSSSSSLFALGVPFFPPSQNETAREQQPQKNQQFNEGNSNSHSNSKAGVDSAYKYPDFQRKTKKGSTEIHDL